MKVQMDLPIPPINTPEGCAFLWRYLLEARQPSLDGPSNPTNLVDERTHDFLVFCMQNHQTSVSGLFQDLYVLFMLGFKREGYFVEFGVSDGLIVSNSLLLESKFGWRGIVVEPNPVWHEKLKVNRQCDIDLRCVWRKTGETIKFLSTKLLGLATISEFKDADQFGSLRSDEAEEIDVPTVSLNDLLAEHGAPADFDYLSVDTEGSEYEILRHMDFDRYRPKIITVEHNYHNGLRNDVFQLLSGKGYVRDFEVFSMAEDWYYLPS